MIAIMIALIIVGGIITLIAVGFLLRSIDRGQFESDLAELILSTGKTTLSELFVSNSRMITGFYGLARTTG